MKTLRTLLQVTGLAVLLSSAAWADAISKEQAVDRALGAHPGKVEKAYQETKKGVLVWEVEIEGDDGNQWKAYYRVDNGALFMKKRNDEVVEEQSET